MSQTTGKQKSSSELVKTPQFKKMLMKMIQYELIMDLNIVGKSWISSNVELVKVIFIKFVSS